MDPGPVSQRFRPRAFGRAAPIRRRTSHVILVLEAKGAVARPYARKGDVPVVREATREDMRRGADAARAAKPGGREGEVKIRKTKPISFVRRIFQRKVI